MKMTFTFTINDLDDAINEEELKNMMYESATQLCDDLIGNRHNVQLTDMFATKHEENKYSPAVPSASETMFQELVQKCHAYAVDNGFWDDEVVNRDNSDSLYTVTEHARLSAAFEASRKGETYIPVLDPEVREYSDEEALFATRISLMHTELSEAWEALTNGNPPSEKIDFSHVEEELADVLIRIFDECGRRGWDIGGAVVAKMSRNSKRPYRHGKKF